MSFDEILKAWDWRPIRGCPGRLVIRDARPDLRLEEVAGGAVDVREFQVEAARDTVLVARLDRGGIISYRREDGSFVHTLNTDEGFERKLRQLGVDYEKG